ncbi:MAG: serine/threonine-protein kinase [Lachnospira sp.]
MNRLLDDKYDIIQMLGATGHSTVYLVRHRILNVFRVAKIILKADQNSLGLLMEANLIKDMKYPDIPMIYDIEEDDTHICIIEEYITGISLNEYVHNIIEKKGRMSTKDICRISIELCNILEYLHNYKNGIIHLDLKPDNIIISENGKVKLIDFDNALENNNCSMLKGTPGFASPEQYVKCNLSKQSDIYSLGVIIFFMVNNGNLDMNIEKVNYHELYPIIKKSIRHNKIFRYENVVILRKDLERIINNTDKNNMNGSGILHITGIRAGIGTTHVALCMAHFFEKNGYSCMIMDNSEGQHLLNEGRKGKLTKEGLYKYNGVLIAPDYREGIDVRYPRTDVIIADDGIYGHKEYLDDDLVFIVCGGKYGPDEEKRILENVNGAAVFLNLMSAQDFYAYTRSINDEKHYYRVPCVYNWTNGNDLFDETMEDVVRDYLPYMMVCRSNHFTIINRLKTVKEIMKLLYEKAAFCIKKGKENK